MFLSIVGCADLIRTLYSSQSSRANAGIRASYVATGSAQHTRLKPLVHKRLGGYRTKRRMERGSPRLVDFGFGRFDLQRQNLGVNAALRKCPRGEPQPRLRRAHPHVVHFLRLWVALPAISAALNCASQAAIASSEAASAGPLIAGLRQAPKYRFFTISLFSSSATLLLSNAISPCTST